MTIDTLRSGYAYLASPYSHPTMRTRVERYMEAADFVAWAFRQEIPIFSPIVHWHQVALANEFPTDFAPYKVQNDAMLYASCAMVILCIDGWQESHGIEYEIEKAKEWGRPIYYANSLNRLNTQYAIS